MYHDYKVIVNDKQRKHTPVKPWNPVDFNSFGIHLAYYNVLVMLYLVT